jgi:hypothetical protein
MQQFKNLTSDIADLSYTQEQNLRQVSITSKVRNVKF